MVPLGSNGLKTKLFQIGLFKIEVIHEYEDPGLELL